MRVRFFWDFHGNQAQGTAEHFLHHLEEFLTKHALSLNAGVIRVEGGHFAAFCDPPDVPGAMSKSDDRSTDEAALGDAVPDAAASGVGAKRVADQIGRALRPSRVEVIESAPQHR